MRSTCRRSAAFVDLCVSLRPRPCPMLAVRNSAGRPPTDARSGQSGTRCVTLTRFSRVRPAQTDRQCAVAHGSLSVPNFVSSRLRRSSVSAKLPLRGSRRRTGGFWRWHPRMPRKTPKTAPEPLKTLKNAQKQLKNRPKRPCFWG